MAQQLHQQPAGVAAGAKCQLQCFLRRLYAGFHADGVFDVLLQLLVNADQKIVGAARCAVDFVEIGLQQGRGGFNRQVGREFLRHGWGVFERKLFRLWLQEKIKRVQRDHIDHHVHRHLEFTRWLGEHQARLVVGKRVLLPVDEMICWLDSQRIRQNLRSAVRCRAQPHNLGAERDQTVIFVVGNVAEGNVNGQGDLALWGMLSLDTSKRYATN